MAQRGAPTTSQTLTAQPPGPSPAQRSPSTSHGGLNLAAIVNVNGDHRHHPDTGRQDPMVERQRELFDAETPDAFTQITTVKVSRRCSRSRAHTLARHRLSAGRLLR